MLALTGCATIVIFMIAIMSKRLSAFVALVIVPIAAAVFLGNGTRVAEMAIAGVAQLVPVLTVLVFAVIYFGIMIDAGLFDPLVRRTVTLVGGDPMKVSIGTAIVALIVSLDGDGATTAMVTISAFLPIYRQLGMNVLILATLLGLSNTIVNIAPWGGPTGRIAAALKLDPGLLFVPLVPTIVAGMGATVAIAWWLGRGERRRLGVQPMEQADRPPFPDREPGIERPRLLPLNLALTALVIGCAVTHLLPLPFVFMAAAALAVTLNYPNVAEQRDRLAGHATNVLPITLLVLSAGVFIGIVEGTGMLAAMAASAVSFVPPDLGAWLGPLTALLSGPLTFVLSNDAYYFGIVPVIARTAQEYGVDPAAIARASLLGQPLHGLSPLVAAVYLVVGLLKVEFGAMVRFSLKYALLVTATMIVTAMLTRAIV